MSRIVVVGSGLAGLVTAYRASEHHDVILVSKAELSESNTRYAQGGIAAVMSVEDSIVAHVADTMVAGSGLCDRQMVELMCSEGPERIHDLIALGVEFDRVARSSSTSSSTSTSSGSTEDLALAQEAAHSARRIVHAGGDATGFFVEAALVRAVRARAVGARPIELHEHTFMRDLVLSPDDNGTARVVGVDVIGADGAHRRILADRVVLASGGAGQLYRHTTNPTIATGDGAAAAWRAGAVLTDVEFYQFHPTALAVDNSPLISEAVRGEGAVLLDENGYRFMLAEHPDAELAPRDVVARAMATVMAKQGGRPVSLDATALGANFLAHRFPGITGACADAGFDWSVEPVPVAPAAHYWMGGIRTDDRGRTSLPGLFAVGEVASTGVQGANRLASNSLLEALVFSWRAADALVEPATAADFASHPLGASEATRPNEKVVDAVAGTSPFTRSALQHLMWNQVGLERGRAGLVLASAQLSLWADALTGSPTATVTAHEDRNLLTLASVIVSAALAREESRGAHYRADFPFLNREQAHSSSWSLGISVNNQAKVRAS
jgi:L-aspartate oxidase